MDVRSIPLAELLPPLYPVRRVADDEKMAELVRSIKVNGLFHPLTVIPEDGAFRILAGHRRYIAVSGIGWEEVDCNVIKTGPTQKHMVSIEENEIREEVNPVDTGWYLRYLCENEHMTQRQIAQLRGKSDAWVSQRIRLTLLDEGLQELVQEAKLPWRGALRLNTIENPAIKEAYVREAVARQSSVHDIEAAVTSLDRNLPNIEQAVETAQAVRDEQAAESNPLCCFGCGVPAVERPGTMAWLCAGCVRAIQEAREKEAVAAL